METGDEQGLLIFLTALDTCKTVALGHQDAKKLGYLV